MFLKNSRYHGSETVEAPTPDGRVVKAVKLRILPEESGSPHTVSRHERLDIIAHQTYRDPTQSWRIADANTELDASELTREPGRRIIVPGK